MKAFWHKTKNFGDTLTPIILEKFLKTKIEFADREEKAKILAVGSVMTAVRENDVVWGTGQIKKLEKPIKAPKGAKFLAVRGPLTRASIDGEVPEVYGDPAILLPLLYNPPRTQKYRIGYLPHYADREIVKSKSIGIEDTIIDITSSPKTIIDLVTSCEMIVTSSLHGIIVAEVYGIPVRWEKYSDNIVGGEFKFQDYFLGTGRKEQKYGLIKDKYNVVEKQKLLLKALRNFYEKN